MPWIKQQAEEHYCTPPEDPTGVTTGDVWECPECFNQLTVKVNDDQRDGPFLTYTFSNGTNWDRYKAHAHRSQRDDRNS